MVFESWKERFGRQVTIEKSEGTAYSFKGFGTRRGLEQKGKEILDRLPKGPDGKQILPGMPVSTYGIRQEDGQIVPRIEKTNFNNIHGFAGWMTENGTVRSPKRPTSEIRRKPSRLHRIR